MVHRSDACFTIAGRAMLTMHLKLRKVLVVVDDAKSVTMLMNLVPP